jgi:putative nucleotidyltransferase with HDIG domain
MLQGWDPEVDRRARELLYRFMEEIGVLRAALYLVGTEGQFDLAVHYGFSRREPLAIELREGHPLFDWVRRHRTSPAYVNNRHEERSLERLMESASSARLMTVPLALGDRLVGFVDARDKAKRAPFEPEDAAKARAIGAALQRLLAETGIYGTPQVRSGAPLPEALQATEVPAVRPSPPQSDDGMDPRALRGLAASIRQATSLPGIAAAALSVGDGRTMRVLLVSPLPFDGRLREALVSHQAQQLTAQGVQPPPPAGWGIAEERGGGEERRCEAIHTAVLSSRPAAAVVVSVVTPVSSPAAAPLLDLLARQFVASLDLVRYRRAARNLARTLLEPGETSFPHLRQHSQAVSELAQRLAAAVALSEADEELAVVGGYLHDVGMRELDYARLYRFDNPGEGERRVYRRHPLVGAQLLAGTEFPGDLAGVVRHHHERWDGAGYPDRLAGATIPLASRIIHLAEVYDVLTSTASYRRPVPRDEALRIIRAEAGKQFDPELVHTLQELLAP